jgi:hypothetical protein
VYH